MFRIRSFGQCQIDVIWHSICRLSIGQIVTAIRRSMTNGTNCLSSAPRLHYRGSLNEREVTNGNDRKTTSIFERKYSDYRIDTQRSKRVWSSDREQLAGDT